MLGKARAEEEAQPNVDQYAKLISIQNQRIRIAEDHPLVAPSYR